MVFFGFDLFFFSLFHLCVDVLFFGINRFIFKYCLKICSDFFFGSRIIWMCLWFSGNFCNSQFVDFPDAYPKIRINTIRYVIKVLVNTLWWRFILIWLEIYSPMPLNVLSSVKRTCWIFFVVWLFLFFWFCFSFVQCTFVFVCILVVFLCCLVLLNWTELKRSSAQYLNLFLIFFLAWHFLPSRVLKYLFLIIL